MLNSWQWETYESFFFCNNFYAWSLRSMTDLIHFAILCEAVCLSNPPSTGPNALLSACVQIPPCSPWDKLPFLPSIQERVITLSARWQARIGWPFVNRRRSRVTAQPFPSLSSSLPPLHASIFPSGREIYSRPPLIHRPPSPPPPPNLLTLRAPVIHEVVIKATVLRLKKRRGGGTWVRDLL